MSPVTPTPRQAAALAVIVRRTRERGVAISLAAVAAELGSTRQAVHKLVGGLRDRGLVGQGRAGMHGLWPTEAGVRWVDRACGDPGETAPPGPPAAC